MHIGRLILLILPLEMAELRLFLGKDGHIQDVSGGYQISYGVHIDLNLVDLAELIEGQGRDGQ